MMNDMADDDSQLLELEVKSDLGEEQREIVLLPNSTSTQGKRYGDHRKLKGDKRQKNNRNEEKEPENVGGSWFCKICGLVKNEDLENHLFFHSVQAYPETANDNYEKTDEDGASQLATFQKSESRNRNYETAVEFVGSTILNKYEKVHCKPRSTHDHENSLDSIPELLVNDDDVLDMHPDESLDEACESDDSTATVKVSKSKVIPSKRIKKEAINDMTPAENQTYEILKPPTPSLLSSSPISSTSTEAPKKQLAKKLMRKNKTPTTQSTIQSPPLSSIQSPTEKDANNNDNMCNANKESEFKKLEASNIDTSSTPKIPSTAEKSRKGGKKRKNTIESDSDSLQSPVASKSKVSSTKDIKLKNTKEKEETVVKKKKVNNETLKTPNTSSKSKGVKPPPPSHSSSSPSLHIFSVKSSKSHETESKNMKNKSKTTKKEKQTTTEAQLNRDSSSHDEPLVKKGGKKKNTSSSKSKEIDAEQKFEFVLNSKNPHKAVEVKQNLRCMMSEMMKENPDLSLLNETMAATYKYRRYEIENGEDFSVDNAIIMFPALQHYKMLQNEFDRMHKKKKVSIKLLNSLLQDPLEIKYSSFCIHNYLCADNVLGKALKDYKHDERNTVLLRDIQLLCLAFYKSKSKDKLHLNGKLFKSRKEQEEAFINLDGTPTISILGDLSAKDTKYFVYCEGMNVTQAPNLYEAFISVYCIYWIFGIRYEPACERLFQYFDKVLGLF